MLMSPKVKNGPAVSGVAVLLILLLLTVRMLEVMGFHSFSSTANSKVKAQKDAIFSEQAFMATIQRSVAYMAVGEAHLAIEEVSNVLQERPNFQQARLQRGAFYILMGDYDLARDDFDNVLYDDPHNAEALASHQRISDAEDKWETAQDLAAIGEHAQAISLLSLLLHMSPWSVPYRDLRADAYVAVNDLGLAVADMRIVIRLSRGQTDAYPRLSSVLLKQGDIAGAINELRICLRLDPDNPVCFCPYKTLRQVEKLLAAAAQALKLGDYPECITAAENAQSVIRTEPQITFEALRLRCSCYVSQKRHSKALLPCESALKIKSDSRVHCDLGAAYVALEMFDKALHNYEQALELDKKAQCAKRGIGVAHRQLKKTEQKNYYLILGVSRNANKKEIQRAYRRAAQKWHPDNFKDEEKKYAESKFLDIVAAKEVLFDPEKRELFDQGVDPLNPQLNLRRMNFNY